MTLRSLSKWLPAALCTAVLYAEGNPNPLWLNYPVIESAEAKQWSAIVKQVMSPGSSEILRNARNELITASSKLTKQKVVEVSSIAEQGTVLLGTRAQLQQMIPSALADRAGTLKDGGYLIESTAIDGKDCTVIVAKDEPGVLYGVFHFLRLMQTGAPAASLRISSEPAIDLRMLNHWDNMGGDIERGYGGKSLWKWDELPGQVNRQCHEYARFCASLGINGVVLNNVNANPIILRKDYLAKVAALADVFRTWGIRTYLCVNFCSPIHPDGAPGKPKRWRGVGTLATADPLDPAVRAWWTDKAAEIHALIPDFGGFLVKADSEGMPGPEYYKRTHLDGANMLADALAPIGGTLIWRAFVYGRSEDRAMDAYNEFKQLDGKFRDNVFLQIKNGPLDFQPREPLTPLFGSMPNTDLSLELQIAKEYLGQATTLAYLGPMWKEVLGADTHAKGNGSTIAKVIDGSLDGRKKTCIAGVANTGDGPEWCGSVFNQANWYAFGRLAWDPQLGAEEIADEWIRMTFACDAPTRAAILKMMMGSHEAIVDYSMPLGLNFLSAYACHYAPKPEERGYFHKADATGIGFDRTERGSNYIGQYHPGLRAIFNDRDKTPPEYLLWFHHVPWDAKLSTGRTLWEELEFRYNRGVSSVDQMAETWQSLEGKVSPEIHASVTKRLEEEKAYARQWRDACLRYFSGFARKAEASSVMETSRLFQQFQNPPHSAKPSGYWWWLYNNVDKASITRDLEEFHDKGIGAVLLVCSGNWGAGPIPSGPEFLSAEWKELFVHALREAQRLDIVVDVNIAPGWNMGGPWITPDKACRWYLQSETTLEGPRHFKGALPLPGVNDGYNDPPQFGVKKQLAVPMEEADYRDTALVAFRVPEEGLDALKHARADLPAKSARSDGDVWVRAEKVMGDPRKPWKKEEQDVAIAPGDVVDLTKNLGADGVLDWQVPEGKWVLVRTGHRKTGAMMVVPIPGKEGLENDFLDRAGVELMFEHSGKLMAEWAGPMAGKTLRGFCSDSFEAGFPNWTANMPKHFRKYRGYDMTPYLPVLRGYLVGSAEISERFLHDYRKTIADCMADEHYGRFGELAAAYGMEIRAESAGPNWSATLCMDGLKNLGRVQHPQGEFWRNGFRVGEQNQVGKQTSSAAHIYGRKTASAEAFTSSGNAGKISVHWSAFPENMKPIGDRAFCEGINYFVFHTITAQRPQDGKPGFAYGAGTHFTPNVTWWNQAAKPWLDYVQRCQAMLQSGLFVADVLHYNGDWAPNVVAAKHVDPRLGKGYDYDVCNEEVLLTRLSVKDGRIVLPDGMSYRLLVLPEETRMPAAVALKIAELVKAGATVVGPRPVSDPGLRDYPACDSVVRQVADELWGGSSGTGVVDRKVGQGRVFSGRSLREILLGDGVSPDFEIEGNSEAFIDFIHRETDEADLYFVCNRNDRAEDVTMVFRQDGRQPELWDAVSGSRRVLPEYRHAVGRTHVPYRFGPHESAFIVFPKSTPPARAMQGMNVAQYEPVHVVDGKWTVRFDREWFYPVDGLQGKEAEGEFLFQTLDDWSQRPEPAVRHFSGTATYHATFDFAAEPEPGEEYHLDLGKVSVSAKVRLNGREIGVVWCAPWRVDVSKALKRGLNEIEIEVVNCWPNRLIGDGLLPVDQRRTRTNLTAYEPYDRQGRKKDLELLPSGLHGPVRVMKKR